VPAMVERLSGARPDCSVTLLHGVGHYPMVEAPDRFVEALAGAGAGAGAGSGSGD